ncbi:alpha-amylase family glycosyl hydrolase [Streptomyces sp. H34-S4]|uniref:alpha-amylase family glycosyl hydrolase n=1 Tax=Streptomyces sp. H34-S4 TaxID=2996463 RepID=UPI0022702F23|nr:alpha-amylase family glycosyl hydrolase [Streptomyces sp. H34-S4]MCY0937050.1 alpha-amylase family glycosyl hydrolase [Streptomyces sp. H34-S4]
MPQSAPSPTTSPWWRHAAIYQIYIRSFADGSGDGIGDIAGVRERLPYLRQLGVDALWFNPWYVSPMADAGYDVADYRDIDPIFGTLAEAEELINEAHGHELRVIVDLVPNHCSDRHPWFVQALAAGPGSPERERFWFLPGRGAHGELPPNVFIGEVWLPEAEQFARYLRHDELHSAFNFDYLCSPWDSGALRKVVDATLASHEPVGAPPTWVLSNHDTIRHVTRYGRADTSFDMGDKRLLDPSDPGLGRHRGRAAALVTFALPGGVYVYQGDELGLPEVQDLPDEVLQDPTFVRSGGADRGRDGCRVPLPWEAAGTSLGFSTRAGEDTETTATAPAAPWLPQPEQWTALSAAAQHEDPYSVLTLYREALALRGAELARLPEVLEWVDAGPDTLCFDRPGGFRCLTAFANPVPLPGGARVLLASGPLGTGADGGPVLPADTTVWLRMPG